MPRIMRNNDAIRYPQNHPRKLYFTWDKFNNPIKALEKSNSYRMITFDTFGTRLLNKEVFVKIEVKGD